MESQVIQPAAGQAILTTSDGHRNHESGRHEWAETILREQLANFRDSTRQREDGKVTTFGVAKDVASAAKDAAVGFKDGLVTAYQVEGRGLVEAAKNAAAVEVQAEKLAAASILDATKNAAAAAAQLAACCCEIKEKIGSDGDETRALLNGIALQDQRDRAAKAESMLAAYYARNAPPVTPSSPA